MKRKDGMWCMWDLYMYIYGLGPINGMLWMPWAWKTKKKDRLLLLLLVAASICVQLFGRPGASRVEVADVIKLVAHYTCAHWHVWCDIDMLACPPPAACSNWDRATCKCCCCCWLGPTEALGEGWQGEGPTQRSSDKGRVNSRTCQWPTWRFMLLLTSRLLS
jgi:hypothetical protein